MEVLLPILAGYVQHGNVGLGLLFCLTILMSHLFVGGRRLTFYGWCRWVSLVLSRILRWNVCCSPLKSPVDNHFHNTTDWKTVLQILLQSSLFCMGWSECQCLISLSWWQWNQSHRQLAGGQWNPWPPIWSGGLEQEVGAVGQLVCLSGICFTGKRGKRGCSHRWGSFTCLASRHLLRLLHMTCQHWSVQGYHVPAGKDAHRGFCTLVWLIMIWWTGGHVAM